jgi:hypothetical protein
MYVSELSLLGHAIKNLGSSKEHEISRHSVRLREATN